MGKDNMADLAVAYLGLGDFDAKALPDFTGNEMSFKKGEGLTCWPNLKVPDGWLLARNKKGTEGVVPVSWVKQDESKASYHEAPKWKLAEASWLGQSWKPKLSCTASISGHKGSVRCCVFVGEERVASCSDDGTVRVWDLKDGKQLAVMQVETSFGTAKTLVSNGEMLAFDTKGGVEVWSLQTYKCVAQFDPHPGQFHTMAWADAQTLVTGGRDQLAHVWLVSEAGGSTNVKRVASKHHEDRYGSVWAVAVDGDVVASATNGQVIKVCHLCHHLCAVTSAAGSPAHNPLFPTTHPCSLSHPSLLVRCAQVWSRTTEEDLAELEDILKTISMGELWFGDIALDLGSERLVSADWNGQIIAWSTKSWDVLINVYWGSPVEQLTLQGDTLAIAGKDEQGKSGFMDMRSGEPVCELAGIVFGRGAEPTWLAFRGGVAVGPGAKNTLKVYRQ